MPNLKPCPFCRGKMIVRALDGDVQSLICLSCHASAPPHIWNRRALDWISVDERLPSLPNQAVLIANIHGDVFDNAYYSTDRKTFMFNYGGFNDEKVVDTITHWMPLPEPPKGE